MAYAPHYNDDVHYQRLAGIVALPILQGAFKQAETEAFFEYGERLPGVFADDIAPECNHVIFMSDGSTRLANILRTVAYVVIDEDATGAAVIERWPLKQHRPYDTEWIGGQS